MSRTRVRRPPVEASNETVVYVPEKGFVKVGELKAKLATEAKPKVTTSRLVELEKATVAKVVERGGKVSRSELKEVLEAIKEEKCTKRGVTLTKLIGDGFVARIKVPGMRPFYAITEKGAKESGIQAKGK